MDSELLYKEFGLVLKRARKNAKLTQEGLSSKVGLSRTSITNIEQGRQHVTLHLLFLLAKALSVKPSVLLPDVNHMNEIGESEARLIEKAGLTIDVDVKSWIGKVLAAKEKKENYNE